MSHLPHLVGMIHLEALPGAPLATSTLAEVRRRAVDEAEILVDIGFPALLVENFGDVPFFTDRVPASTVAAMTSIVDEVVAATGVPIGVNVLRNDALAALGIAGATGARFIRVNVLTGVMYTDQGAITGKAAEVARERAATYPDIEIWADVLVKHATPPPGTDVRQAAEDVVHRGLADAVIVSGSGTGAEVDVHEASLVRSAVPGTRVVVGSGAAAANLGRLMEVVDSVIVGSAVREHGQAGNTIDEPAAKEFVAAARDHGLL